MASRSFILGYGVTLADIAIWAALQGVQRPKCLNSERWFDHCAAQSPFAEAKSLLTSKIPAPSQSEKPKDVGTCPPLEGAVEGQVVTRFPPEPSGYLHIGE